jgi:hypothetical protein
MAESARDKTREAFLAAGVRLYGSMSDRLLRGYTAGAVATEAGFRRQTFYRYWDTQADYVRDLLLHLLVEGEAAADGVAVLPSRRGEQTDWGDLARDIARYDYGRMASDPRVRMRLGLATMEAAAALGLEQEAQDFYDRVTGRMAEAMAATFDEVGRRPRSPLSVRDLVRVQRALLIGLMLLDLGVGPEPPGIDLYEQIFVWIGEALTEEDAAADVDLQK